MIKKIKYLMISLTIFCFFLFIIGQIGLKTDDEKISYIENTNLKYSVKMKNGVVYDSDDGVRINSGDVEMINIIVDYYNNKNDKTGLELNAYMTLYINSRLNNTIEEKISLRETIVKNFSVKEDKTTVEYEIRYLEKNNFFKQYVLENNLNEGAATGIIEVSLSVGEELFYLSVSLSEDDLQIIENKTIDKVIEETGGDFWSFVSIMSLFFFVVLLVGIIMLIKYEKLTYFEQQRYKIFKFNSSILVHGNMENLDLSSFTKVDSFKELLKVQVAINIPIVYQENNHGYLFVIKMYESGYYYMLNNKDDCKKIVRSKGNECQRTRRNF